MPILVNTSQERQGRQMRVNAISLSSVLGVGSWKFCLVRIINFTIERQGCVDITITGFLNVFIKNCCTNSCTDSHGIILLIE